MELTDTDLLEKVKEAASCLLACSLRTAAVDKKRYLDKLNTASSRRRFLIEERRVDAERKWGARNKELLLNCFTLRPTRGEAARITSRP
jgi:hypothetical protein